MMILISGQPGNGKTLRALALMREEYERNAEAVKAGKEQPRRFYSNVAGATREENPEAFPWVEPIPFAESPDSLPQQRRPDWRLCADGAYVLYDEAHADGATEGLERYGVLFPGTGKPGESDDPRVRAMSTHRHRGFDLVFMTQWPSKVHHNVRQLVGKHIHMNRALGLQRAGTVSWTRVQPDPYDERQREKAEEEIWAYPQDLYGKYFSATLHTATYKFKIPKKVWGALSMALAIPLVFWLLWSVVFHPGDASAQAEQDQAKPQAIGPLGPGAAATGQGNGQVYSNAREYVEAFTPRIPAAPWTAPAYDGREVVAKPVAMCVKSGAGLDGNGEFQRASCSCLTEQGTRYAMPAKSCEAVVDNGGMYNPFLEPVESRGGLIRDAAASQTVTAIGASGHAGT